jgi:hypothetical protein
MKTEEDGVAVVTAVREDSEPGKGVLVPDSASRAMDVFAAAMRTGQIEDERTQHARRKLSRRHEQIINSP